MSFRTHLTILQWSASLYSEATVFEIPDFTHTNGTGRRWNKISYRQFLTDVELSARYWGNVLQSRGVHQRSVVGLWLGGMTYMDVLHIFGVARANYIPQLFSLRLPNPDVIYELMQRADAKALIFDPSFESVVTSCPTPSQAAIDLHRLPALSGPLPALSRPSSGEDTAMIFHTSGSTSGSPKLVRCSYKWLDAIIAKAGHISEPCRSDRQDVITWMGSMCHIGQTLTLIGGLQHGTCVVQPTTIAFSSDELLDIIRQCGLNRLTQFATFLATHLRNSQEDSRLLASLQRLDEVLYAGLPLPQGEEIWARQNGLLLRNLFGNTECGAMLRSIGGRGSDSHFLRPIEGTQYRFDLVTPAAERVDDTYRNSNAQLLELVILSDSGDCPDPSLRQADGHFHTGDLFIEAAPGCYLFRGRDDDWIKSENSLRCDTKAIEDNVRSSCGDLVSECVVVGNGRPSPALFVEPKGLVDGEKLKKDIIRRTRHFHSRRYIHERIVSTHFIVVVSKGSLPRTATKGNIRRRAVEETFKVQLDRIYKSQ
ncbi:acetyl-CoA synthetase-like protein [Laetiporus sulphureus 93-53]|uniref:Acetyl-CoA synthetase-like protein n=1 Tax=Laetiporus sulphureus 93-53 TaxID=1314785 RepID=A0A165DYU2_9APHY|nr:acetyl-CoA synthetase-like protein [Laetiporus sulphureus 93-53]KZT05908.1 acetyl-CoA synthetase-like protein [Laetiporus sulphureus 93-53]